ncbi:MAG: hypothetical protein KF688_02720 [Pirellulales bacterium]|nr:hypothetical protein [Pirellulales bacterium]
MNESPTGPQLLVSVRDAAEALAALAGGADWIDLKEPARGPLGPVDVATARSVAQIMPAGTPLSAAGGELCDALAGAARPLRAVSRIEWMKLGLADCDPRDEAARAAAPFSTAALDDLACRLAMIRDEFRSTGKRLVLTAYADAAAARAPSPEVVLQLVRRLRLSWLLIDTWDKSGPALGERLPPPKLAKLLAACHAQGVRTAVAGRLRLDDFGRLPRDVDLIGVRGAACGGDRAGRVDAEAVRRLAAALAVNARSDERRPAAVDETAIVS